MSIKAKIEAIIYAAEDPVTFEQIFALVKEEARAELKQKQQRQAASKAEPVVVSVEDGAEVPLEDPTVPAESAPEIIPSETEANVEAGASDAVQDEVPATDGVAPEALEQQQPAEKPEPEPITDAEVKSALRATIEELMADYTSPERGIEVRQIAGGYRMATKPEQHDAVRAFAKSLKPPIRLSLQALETLAVIAYKQPITAPEISEVRGVDAGGVLGTLLDRKLITTAGRKQVIGRPILYKTTKEFLLRFGLKDVNELPSMEEFEKLAAESLGADLFAGTQAESEQSARGGVTPEAASDKPADSEEPPSGEAEAAPDPDGQPVAAEASAQGTDAEPAPPEETAPEETPAQVAESQSEAADASIEDSTPAQETSR